MMRFARYFARRGVFFSGMVLTHLRSRTYHLERPAELIFLKR